MSQENRPAGKNTADAAPVVHRYDPRQNRSLPPMPAIGGAIDQPAAPIQPSAAVTPSLPTGRPVEIGGPSGPEPTRYGDWERNGRVSDF